MRVKALQNRPLTVGPQKAFCCRLCMAILRHASGKIGHAVAVATEESCRSRAVLRPY